MWQFIKIRTEPLLGKKVKLDVACIVEHSLQPAWNEQVTVACSFILHKSVHERENLEHCVVEALCTTTETRPTR